MKAAIYYFQLEVFFYTFLATRWHLIVTVLMFNRYNEACS